MSLRGLCERDEIVVFAPATAADDMMNLVESQSPRRRRLLCRMNQADRSQEIQHGMSMLTETYDALFASDPEITLNDAVIYDGRVFMVTGCRKASGQGWLWRVGLVHNPGLHVDAAETITEA